ncbi:nucleotide-binding universal stress UspA family protein [Albidovulum inexpectatum]|uniref:Nucleotide-binding universal stress UspA family protein n=1 Tax=Albidovulum inexpectatum TaxID=196587 RepID=A0A2S5JHF4_9RHOB|nr:universal stress protein [Albidovulum inexpectatum]PPB80944.1 nucleotide-binding universal stress UspA family protein [Albidovulum inexpectatum]
MYQHVLIPVALDHESVLPRKLEIARRLQEPGGRITVMTVLEDVPAFVSEFIDVKPPKNLSERVRQRLLQATGDLPNVEAVVIRGRAGLAIAEYARENGVDLIIVGAQKPGVQDYLLGSTAARVSRRAPCSVFIMR